MKRTKYTEGYRKGQLTLIKKNGYRGNNLLWQVKCDCGVVKDMTTSTLIKSVSCGCSKYLDESKWLGKKFGLWTVIARSERLNPTYWICQCQCGVTRDVLASSLVRDVSKSCGCAINKSIAKTFKRPVHGMTNTKLYRIWNNMIYNCNSRKRTMRNSEYDDKYARFTGFYEDASVNYVEGARLNRIDRSEPYTKSNLEWIYPNGDFIQF